MKSRNGPIANIFKIDLSSPTRYGQVLWSLGEKNKLNCNNKLTFVGHAVTFAPSPALLMFIVHSELNKTKLGFLAVCHCEFGALHGIIISCTVYFCFCLSLFSLFNYAHQVFFILKNPLQSWVGLLLSLELDFRLLSMLDFTSVYLDKYFLCQCC